MTAHAAGEEAGIRSMPLFSLPADLVDAIEAWIAQQPSPRPTLSQAVEEILREAMNDHSSLTEFST